jgi:hypothetical protein
MEFPIFATYRCICHHFRDFSSNFDAKSESFHENTKTKNFVSTLALAPATRAPATRAPAPTLLQYSIITVRNGHEKLFSLRNYTCN